MWAGLNLEDDEEGEEEQHKQQQTAGVHGQQVVFVGEVRLERGTEHFIHFR